MKPNRNFLIPCALSFLLVGAACQRPPTKQAAVNTTVTTNLATVQNTNIRPDDLWKTQNGAWFATSPPPPCTEPIVFQTPTDITKVTSILYPGQPRGNAWKPHGGFRFSDQTPNNAVNVTVPYDAQIIQGTRAFRNGENQYGFVFLDPCGINYSLGHLLELTPKFLAIANKLLLVEDVNGVPPAVQNYAVDPPVPVTTGEVMATKVGYAIPHNVFFDFGVLDLRHPNGFTIRPEWAKQFGNDFDRYAACWLDLLPSVDGAQLRTLRGGDSVNGQKSDYCGT